MTLALSVDHEIEEAVKHNWSVIPIGSDKRPLTDWKQYQQQPASLDQINEWAATKNPAAWAVVTGQVSGVFVLDFDGADGWQLARSLGLNKLAQVFTPSRGLHLYISTKDVKFRVPSRTRVLPGLDVRGEGGYAGFHGSVLGGSYIWIHETITPEPWGVLPLEILEALGSTSSAGGGHVRAEAGSVPRSGHCASATTLLRMALAKATAGIGRNRAGFWLAAQLRDNRYDYDEALEVLTQYRKQVRPTNTRGIIEPYTEREVLDSLNSAYSWPARDCWRQSR